MLRKASPSRNLLQGGCRSIVDAVPGNELAFTSRLSSLFPTKQLGCTFLESLVLLIWEAVVGRTASIMAWVWFTRWLAFRVGDHAASFLCVYDRSIDPTTPAG